MKIKKGLFLAFAFSSLLLSVDHLNAISKPYQWFKVHAKEALLDGASVYQKMYEDGFSDGVEVVWNTGNICKDDTEIKKDGTKSWKVEVNPGATYVEYYCSFPKIIDFRHGDKVGTTDSTFKKIATIEFDLYLDCDPGWYNFFLLEHRGEEYKSRPINQQYNRSFITLDKYVDYSLKKQWQHVQIPVSAFSTSGNRANETGTASEKCMVDLTNISGFGVCHMINNTGAGYFYYDNMEIDLNNKPDEYLGCNMIRPDEFLRKIENKEIKMTPIDISSLTTTAFTGGEGKGWSGQGTDNELTGFDMFGDISYNGIQFHVLDPNEHVNTAIALGSESNLNIPRNSRNLYVNEVEIPIHQKADGLYMIHNAAWDGKKVAKYTYQYQDGTSYSYDIMQGREIFGWWKSDESDVCPIIWSGNNVEATSFSLGIKLNMFAFVNPLPEKVITSLKCEINSDTTVDLIVAVTAADCGGNGLYMQYMESKYNPDTTSWYNYELPNYDDYIGSALDVSYLLDADINSNGYITTEGEHFVNQKGERVNFWGINVSGQSFFGTSKEEINKLVDVIAAMGYNLVRLIDWDAGFYAPNIFGATGGSSALNAQSVDEFNYFWSCLKRKGIYLDMVMLGGRYGSTLSSLGTFTEEEMNDISSGLKFETYIDERLVNETKRVVKELFKTTNTYTGTALADDPALALVEVANENNLTNIYGVYTSSTTYEFVSSSYKATFQSKFNSWLLELYGSNDALKEAWKDKTGSGLDGLSRRENCEEGTVLIPQSYLNNDYSRQRINDTFRFLYELQQDYYNEMYQWAKGNDGLGLRVGLCGTTNLPIGDLNDLYVNAAYDYIARHYYKSHPTTGTEFGVDTATSSVGSMVEDMSGNIYGDAAKGDLIGSPYIVNEANEAEPNTHTAEYNIMTSAIFSLQEWSACSFNLSTSPLSDGNRTNMITNAFQFVDHPNRMGTSSAAALLYYAQAIMKNQQTYHNGINVDTAMDPTSQNHSMTSGTYIIANVGNYFYKEDENGNMTYINGDENTIKRNNPALLEKLEHYYVTSEDGSILWSQDGKRFLVNTNAVQGAVGYYNDRTVELSDFKMDIDNDYSVVTLAGLGKKGAMIEDSDRLLLTAAGQCRNTGYELSADGTTIKDLGEGPVKVEQITGTVTIKSLDEFEVYCLNSSGKRVKQAKTSKTEEGFTTIHLELEDHAMNYEIIRRNRVTEPLEKTYDDVYGDMIEKVESVKDALPSITNNLYMLNENITRGDYLVSLVRGLNLETEDEKAYADVSRYYYGYNELKIARGLYLIDGTQAKAYDAMTKVDAYVASYRVLKHLGFICRQDTSILTAEMKANLTEEQCEAIAGLYGSGFIKAEDIKDLTSSTLMSRRDAVNLLVELKNYQNHKQGNLVTKNNIGLIIGIVASSIGVCGVVAACILFFKKKRKNAKI